MLEIKGISGTNYKLQGYFKTPSELESYQGVYVVFDKHNGNYKPKNKLFLYICNGLVYPRLSGLSNRGIKSAMTRITKDRTYSEGSYK